MITLQRLKELLDYNPLTGIFCWKVQVRHRPFKVGDVAGSLHKGSGYRQIMIDRVRYYAHRLAWFYVFGRWPKKQLDHRNRICDDNRLENLREATNGQNQHNAKAKRSGLKGSHFERLRNKWIAQIMHNGTRKFLGRFDTELEAHQAYRRIATQLHGEFARAA